METADRLKQVQEYYFSRKLREVATLEKSGRKIINLAIGSPDLAPPPAVLETLAAAATRLDVHQYQSYQGMPQFREAIAKFSETQYGFQLNPDNEILPLMGSKEGITHISLAFLNKGDKVLIPELGYPTYTSVTHMAEAEPIYYPLLENKNWEPDWAFFETLDFTQIKLLWINYPHMPTGSRDDLHVLKKFVQIAQNYGLLIVSDNPYSMLSNEKPLSIFNVEGAKEVALELNSLSKTFNMAGWRIGWVCGNAENISSVLKIKSNMDSGMFKPLQLAAIEALKQPDKWYAQLAETYAVRRKSAEKLIEKLGCTAAKGQQGMFCWAKIPSGSSLDSFVDQLLYEKGIFITPGSIFGEKGRDYIRVSLCSPVEVFDRAIALV